MSCEHISIELRPKTSETVGLIDEDCVGSRSDVDELRTRDCMAKVDK